MTRDADLGPILEGPHDQHGTKPSGGLQLSVLKAVVDGYPWKATGFVAFLAGSGALYGYLSSIDYIPPDLIGITALGSIAALWLFLIWFCMTVVLFGPAAVIAAYAVKKLDWRTVLIGQLAASTLFLSWVFRRFDWWPWLTLAGVVAEALTLFRLVREEPRRDLVDMFMAAAALLLGSMMLPLGAYMAVETTGIRSRPPTGWTDWRIALYPLLLFALIAANTVVATANERIGAFARGTGCLLATAAVFSFLGGPAYIGALIAERVGLRLPGVATITISKDSCERAFAATQVALNEKSTPITGCQDAVNHVKAEVLLRWSGRWLLAAKEINGHKVEAGAPRFTISDEGTQLVLLGK